MSKYRKYDTCFFERYAQLCLTELLGGEFAGLVNGDRPDLQSPGGTHEVGIEVTRAMEQSKDAARHLLKEMAGVTATEEDLKNLQDLEQLISSSAQATDMVWIQEITWATTNTDTGPWHSRSNAFSGARSPR